MSKFIDSTLKIGAFYFMSRKLKILSLSVFAGQGTVNILELNNTGRLIYKHAQYKLGPL